MVTLGSVGSRDAIGAAMVVRGHELLDRRLAEGTISPEDYRERREILRDSAPPED